jgi:hypothetical protein
VGRSGPWFGTSVFVSRAKSDIKSNTYSDIFDTLVKYLISDEYSLYCIRIRYLKQVSESISDIWKKTFEYPKKYPNHYLLSSDTDTNRYYPYRLHPYLSEPVAKSPQVRV